MALLLKSLLVGCVLYFCFVFGDAASAAQGQLSSVVSEAVERSLSSRVYANVYGHGASLRRFKRDVTSKKLDDPNDCISKCKNNETSMIISATMKNVGKLVALALADVTAEDLRNPDNEALKKRVEDKTIENMGPLFDDLCAISTTADTCYKACPTSQLRQITILDHYTSEVLCEPKNWPNFPEYYRGLNCTNATEEEGVCDSKCGHLTPLSNVTGLELDDGSSSLDSIFDDEDDEKPKPKDDKPESSGTTLKYETDSAKNTDAVGGACKTIVCQLDCSKPLMTERCGAKAYESYARLAKLEPHATLSILKLLHAVGKNNECKNFQ